MNDIQIIVDLILQWGPSLVSIVTMICTVIVAIKQVTKETKKHHGDYERIEKKMESIAQENIDLKRELRITMRKISRIRVPEDKE